jgi:cytidine deaminase
LDVPPSENAHAPRDGTRLSDAELIARAAQALNPQLIDTGFWVADVGAAVEAADGQVYTGACIGGFLSVCAEAAALSHLVAATAPTITRVVAVWKDPSDGALYVIPPCGRCRELMRTLSQKNLEATVILGPDHTATVRDLLPHPGWHAERVRVANAPSITAGPTATRGKGWVRPTNGVSGM